MESETPLPSYCEKLKLIFDELENDMQTENVDKNEIAKNHFERMFEEIDSLLKEHEDDSSLDHKRLMAIKGFVLYDKGKFEYENGVEADSFPIFQAAMKLIENYNSHEFFLFLFARIVNYVAYFLSKEERLEEARGLLEEVLNREYGTILAVYGTEDLLKPDEIDHQKGIIQFNRVMLNNIQQLGWIYGRLGFRDLQAYMEHMHLQKLLDIGEVSIFSWATRCCRLAAIYITIFNWNYARYYLACVEAFLQEKSVEYPARKREIQHSRAELAKAWSHYGLVLFTLSRRNSLEEMYEENPQPDPNKPEELIPEILEQYKFDNFDVTIPDIPVTCVKNIEEARILFYYTQNWLREMRKFYTLREHPLQFVNSVFDLNELYKCLAFYENEMEERYNIQKRRYDTLECLSNLLKEFRPNCYAQLCVELWRELTEVQIDLLGINLKKLYHIPDEPEADDINKRVEAIQEAQNKLTELGSTLSQTETSHI